MATIVTRAGKGSPLTHNEVDSNFTNLNTDKVEIAGTSPVSITVNSASDALRITQTGTGNALLIEDEASTDATPTVVNNAGTVIIGSSTQPVVGNIGGHKLTVSGATADTSAALLYRTDVSAEPAALTFGKTRGTDPLNSGDTIGQIEAAGRDATTAGGGDERTPIGRIVFAMDAAAALDNMPGRIAFQTTPSGSNTPTERMRIDNAGNVGIGATGSAITGQTLTVSKNITGATSAMSIRARGQIQSDVTSAVSMVATFPSTAAATFTLANLYHFIASQNTIDAASTVTNQWGIAIASNLTGATNNYGINSAIASGTNRWNLYISGTAWNYFAGNTGIGAIATTDTLRIGGTITGATTLNSVIIDTTIGSGVTSNYRGFLSRPILQNATFTLANLYHYYANPQTKPAATTITNQYAFHAESTLTDATNNFGFYGNIAAASNRWNFYAAGTAQNYFAGNTFIGATTGDQALNVNGAVRVASATTANQTSAATTDFTGGAMRFLVWGASGTQGNFTWWTGTGALGATQRMTLTGSNNLGLATATFGTSATNTFSVASGTAPTTGVADTVQYYSMDLSAGNTMPAWYTEGTNVGTGTPTANRTIAVNFNGTVYYLLASTIP
jgi:hypothetical protein